MKAVVVDLGERHKIRHHKQVDVKAVVLQADLDVGTCEDVPLPLNTCSV